MGTYAEQAVQTADSLSRGDSVILLVLGLLILIGLFCCIRLLKRTLHWIFVGRRQPKTVEQVVIEHIKKQDKLQRDYILEDLRRLES